MRALVSSVFAISLIAIMLGARPAGAIELGLEPAQPQPGQPFQILAQGDWPLGCAPTPRAAYVEGRDIVWTLEPAPASCAGPKQTQRLRSDVRDALRLAEPGIHRLRVVSPATPGQPARTLAFSLIDSETGARPPRPESGFWWPQANGEFATGGGGIGALLEIQGDMLAINLSGYALDGQPTWWMGAAPLAGRHSRLALTQMREGHGPFDRYAAPKQIDAAGELLVEWQSAARAVFWFVRPREDGTGIDLKPMSMVRFAFASQAGEGWRGRWVLLGAANSGTAALIEFDRVERSETVVLLYGSSGDVLSCLLDAGHRDAPPLACQLALADGSPALDFDDLALNRLRGSDASGAPVQLLKVEP